MLNRSEEWWADLAEGIGGPGDSWDQGRVRVSPLSNWWSLLGEGIGGPDSIWDEGRVLRWLSERVFTGLPQSTADIDREATRLAALIAEEALHYRELLILLAHAGVFFHEEQWRERGLPHDLALRAGVRLFDVVISALQEDAMLALQDQIGAVEDPGPCSPSLGHRMVRAAESGARL